MAFSSNKKNKLFTEINITPLTDIFLVLLIIMMVIAPSFQSMDNNITVPEINSGISVEQKNATISITKDGAYYINGKSIVAENLVSELEAIKSTLEKKEVVVKADKDTKSREIMKVMNCAQHAGYEKLIVAGEPLTKKEQRQLKEDATQSTMSDYTSDVPDSEITQQNRPRVNIPQEG